MEESTVSRKAAGKDSKCFKLTLQGDVEVPALQCHQEADGRLLFHANHAARERYQAVVIFAEDTDVFVLSLAFHDRIGVPLYQKCGNKTHSRIVNITEVAAKIRTSACQALLIGMHAFTGCDTVSAFAGTGKAKSLKLLTKVAPVYVLADRSRILLFLAENRWYIRALTLVVDVL